MQRLTRPAWVRAISGAAGLFLLLLSVGSTPQAVRDTLANVPLLSRPAPWGLILAIAILLIYLGVRAARPSAVNRTNAPAELRRAHDSLVATRIKEWYHAKGQPAYAAADRLFNLAHHMLPQLHAETLPAVQELQYQLRGASSELKGLRAETDPQAAIRALVSAAHWYRVVVAQSAEFARAGHARWSSESSGDYTAWRDSHQKAADSCRELTAGQAFDGVRDVINADMTAMPRFD